MSQNKTKNILKKILGGIIIGLTIITPNLSFASVPNDYNNIYNHSYTNNLKITNKDNSSVLYMEATGYSRYDSGCGSYTATGEYLRYGIAAVDPNVISLGTNMYVDGYGYAIAADTGGAIVGQKIDLAFESHQEALNWGRQYVNVYIQ